MRKRPREEHAAGVLPVRVADLASEQAQRRRRRKQFLDQLLIALPMLRVLNGSALLHAALTCSGNFARRDVKYRRTFPQARVALCRRSEPSEQPTQLVELMLGH